MASPIVTNGFHNQPHLQGATTNPRTSKKENVAWNYDSTRPTGLSNRNQGQRNGGLPQIEVSSRVSEIPPGTTKSQTTVKLSNNNNNPHLGNLNRGTGALVNGQTNSNQVIDADKAMSAVVVGLLDDESGVSQSNSSLPKGSVSVAELYNGVSQQCARTSRRDADSTRLNGVASHIDNGTGHSNDDNHLRCEIEQPGVNNDVTNDDVTNDGVIRLPSVETAGDCETEASAKIIDDIRIASVETQQAFDDVALKNVLNEHATEQSLEKVKTIFNVLNLTVWY